MNQLLQWADGNPGAISFLAQLVDPANFPTSIYIISKLEEAETIRGTNIWVLYSDLCGGNLDKVAILCNKCPTDVLEDACNRQDRSGRALVAEYLS